MGVDNPAAKGHMVTQGVWIDGKYKLIVGQDKKTDEQAKRVQLFDIYADPAEKTNLADKLPDVVQRMQASLDVWRRDVRASYDGRDYAPENRQGTR
jgi:arylsulfatase A-like enzyme